MKFGKDVDFNATGKVTLFHLFLENPIFLLARSKLFKLFNVKFRPTSDFPSHSQFAFEEFLLIQLVCCNRVPIFFFVLLFCCSHGKFISALNCCWSPGSDSQNLYLLVAGALFSAKSFQLHCHCCPRNHENLDFLALHAYQPFHTRVAPLKLNTNSPTHKHIE